MIIKLAEIVAASWVVRARCRTTSINVPVTIHFVRYIGKKHIASFCINLCVKRVPITTEYNQ